MGTSTSKTSPEQNVQTLYKILVELNKTLPEVLDSADLTGLKPEHRTRLLAVVSDFHEFVDSKKRSNLLILDEIELLKVKRELNKPILPQLERIKAHIQQLDSFDYMNWKAGVEMLLNEIWNDDTYVEKLKVNCKVVLGGISATVGAVILVVLIVLHCIPGVNFVLTVAELAFVISALICSVIAAIVQFIIGTKAIQRLKKEFEKMQEVLQKMQKTADDIHDISLPISVKKVHAPEDLEPFISEIESQCRVLKQILFRAD